MFKRICYYAFKYRQTTAFREGFALFTVGGIFAVIALIAQIYHISSDGRAYFFTCALLLLPLIYCLNSKSAMVAYSITVFTLSCTEANLIGRIDLILPFHKSMTLWTVIFTIPFLAYHILSSANRKLVNFMMLLLAINIFSCIIFLLPKLASITKETQHSIDYYLSTTSFYVFMFSLPGLAFFCINALVARLRNEEEFAMLKWLGAAMVILLFFITSVLYYVSGNPFFRDTSVYKDRDFYYFNTISGQVLLISALVFTLSYFISQFSHLKNVFQSYNGFLNVLNHVRTSDIYVFITSVFLALAAYYPQRAILFVYISLMVYGIFHLVRGAQRASFMHINTGLVCILCTIFRYFIIEMIQGLL